MKLTSKGRYAVMALVDLARFDNINPVSLRDISLRQGISLDYLEQIFSKLRKNRGDNEIGLSTGGKFIGLNPENEYSGRPFVFSNRGEVETMEKFLEAANNLDVEAASEFISYPLSYNGMELTKEDMIQEFASRESQSWKPWSMIPIKIYDTDPTSGLIVQSRAKIVRKDGSVMEFEASETYFFDLEEKLRV